MPSLQIRGPGSAERRRKGGGHCVGASMQACRHLNLESNLTPGVGAGDARQHCGGGGHEWGEARSEKVVADGSD